MRLVTKIRMKRTKYILPVVAGVMLGMMLQAFGEKGIHAIYPPPAGITLEDEGALRAYIAQLPFGAFALLIANYLVSSFIAGVISTHIAGRQTIAPAMIAGVLITIASIANAFMIPGQPLWFSVVSILTHLPCTLAGYALVRQKPD